MRNCQLANWREKGFRSFKQRFSTLELRKYGKKGWDYESKESGEKANFGALKRKAWRASPRVPTKQCLWRCQGDAKGFDGRCGKECLQTVTVWCWNDSHRGRKTAGGFTRSRVSNISLPPLYPSISFLGSLVAEYVEKEVCWQSKNGPCRALLP